MLNIHKYHSLMNKKNEKPTIFISVIDSQDKRICKNGI